MLKFTTFVTVVSGILASLAACGGSSRPRTATLDPQRGGNRLEPISTKFRDHAPSISRDGRRFVFVSGREATDAAPALKAFKSDWPDSAAPSAAARVTSADLGVERDARISPDGESIVLTVVKDGRTDLFLQDFAAQKAEVRLTDDAATESSVAYSPDSKLVAWVSRDQYATSTVHIVEIASVSPDAAVTRHPASTDSESPAAAFFLGAATGYQLALALQKSGQATWDLKVRSFDSAAQASSQAATDWLSGFLPGGVEPAPALGAMRVSLIRRVSPAEGKRSRSLTRADLSDKSDLRPLSLEPFVTDPASTTGVTSDPNNLAEVLSHSIAQDGASIFVLGRNHFLCDDVTEGFRFGALMMTGKADGSKLTPLVPVMRPDGSGFDVVNDPCTKRDDGFYVRNDDKMLEMRVNGDASADTFRMLYVTRYSKAFNEGCGLRVGDTEVMALESKAGAKVIYPASNNSANLPDAARPEGEAPCKL